MPKINDADLLDLVLRKDEYLAKQGREPKTRHLLIAMEVMKELGYSEYVMGGVSEPHPVFKNIMDIVNNLFNKRDVAMGGHIGIYVFLDLFAKIGIPIVYGQVRIDPLEFVEITPLRKKLLAADDNKYKAFIDQFCDAWDIDSGVNEIKQPFSQCELCTRFLHFARLHMHAAAAIVTGGYDYRGAVQNAILATELALKAVVASKGIDEKSIKETFGHNISKLTRHLEQNFAEPTLDLQRIGRVVAVMPNFVANRYEPAQPSRLVVGNVVMSAQFVVAEVARLCSERSFRSCMEPTMARVCP